MGSETTIVSRGIAALAWGGLGSALRVSMQIVSQIILARLLGPEQFGLFATALIAATVINFFADFGIAYGLIQKKTVSTDDIRFVSTYQFLLGSSAGLVLFFLAPHVAVFFNNTNLQPIVESLSAVCLVNSLSAVSLNLLKRELNFKRIQLAGTTSYFIGYLVVGIGLAFLGFGVWALIAAFLTTALINWAMLYEATRHPVRPLFWSVEAAPMLRYGLTVLLTNIVNWMVSNIDRTIVARFFASAAVGFYSAAFNLVFSPCLTIISILQPALFSVSARLQGDRDSSRKALLGALAVTSLLVAPVFSGIATVSHTLVLALYGAAWAPVGDLLRPLALAMPMMVMLGMATPTLWVSGKPHYEFLMQIPVACTVLLVCLLAAQFSPLHVAWAVLGLFITRFLVVVGMAARVLRIGVGDVVRALRGGLAVSVLIAGFLWSVDSFLRQLGLAIQLVLVLDIFCAAMVLMGSIAIWPTLIDETLHAPLRRILPNCGWVGKKVMCRLRLEEGGP